MNITLHRKYLKPGYSIGILYVDGQRICETVEDEDRGLSASMPLEEIKARKIKGQTAIPVGIYQVVMSYSPRFKKMLPLIMNVPAYEGIRIHSGNTARDTEGCILCGRNTKVGMVTNSRYWTGKVINMIQAAINRNEQVKIRVTYQYS